MKDERRIAQIGRRIEEISGRINDIKEQRYRPQRRKTTRVQRAREPPKQRSQVNRTIPRKNRGKPFPRRSGRTTRMVIAPSNRRFDKQRRKGPNLNNPHERHVQMLKRMRMRNNVSMNRRIGYNTPMPSINPTERTLGRGMEKIKLVGTEYVTSLTVNTTTNDNPTVAGDSIFCIPINPHYYPGTRLLQISKLYQKYKYINISFEYIPIVPSVQDGALLMYVSGDPAYNNMVNTDHDTRLRTAMAMKGSNMFNVYTYGRTSLSYDDDTLKSYYMFEDQEPRLTNQGVLFIIAGSSYTPFDQTSDTLTLGQLLVHYDIELHQRYVDDISIGNPSTTITWDGTLGWGAVFSGIATNEPIIMYGFTALPAQIDKLYIIRCLSEGQFDGNPISAKTALSTTTQFLSKGSIWFGSVINDGFGIQFYVSMESAMGKSQTPVCLANDISNPLLPFTAVLQFDILDFNNES